MPTYDYLCTKCGLKFEHFQSMSDKHLEVCPDCEGKIRRLVSGGTGLIFKGTGFYLTDYKKKSNSSTTSNKNSKNNTKTEGAKESKPAPNINKESKK